MKAALLGHAALEPRGADPRADMHQHGGAEALPPLFSGAEAYLEMWQRAESHP